MKGEGGRRRLRAAWSQAVVERGISRNSTASGDLEKNVFTRCGGRLRSPEPYSDKTRIRCRRVSGMPVSSPLPRGIYGATFSRRPRRNDAGICLLDDPLELLVQPSQAGFCWLKFLGFSCALSVGVVGTVDPVYTPA